MLGDAGAGAATGIGPRERGRDRRGALSREAVSLDLRLDPRVLEVLNAIAAFFEFAPGGEDYAFLLDRFLDAFVNHREVIAV